MYIIMKIIQEIEIEIEIIIEIEVQIITKVAKRLWCDKRRRSSKKGIDYN